MNDSSSRTPRAAVGVPVYNGERYLEEALRSIQAQTLDDIEIIVSDNASTDRTYEIVRGYAASDERIRYERQPKNRGAAFNYNRVFQLSSAPHFRWVAADDLIAPDLLTRCMKPLQDDPGLVLAYPKTEIIDADGRHVSFYEDNLDLQFPHARERVCALVRRIKLCNAVLGVYRSAALAKTQLIQPFPGSDSVLLFEIALIGRIREVDEVLFRRRAHEEASFEANSTPTSLQAWFAPESPVRKWRLPKRLHLLTQYLRAVRRMESSRAHRAALAAAVTGTWSYRRLRVSIGRWRRIGSGHDVSGERRFPELR